MSKKMTPKESAAFIAQNAEHVSISKEGIEKAAHLLSKGFEVEKFSMKSWKVNELNPQDCMHSSTIDWIFFVDTLNFSFWSEEEYKVTFKGKTYTGYWSLCAAVNRAIEEGCMIISPSFYANVDFESLKHIFRSDSGVEIPLLQQRHDILTQTGKCLLQKFDGSFKNVVEASEKNASRLLQMVIDHFPSYRDEATYKNKKVCFYKRAQILIADLWACFEGEGSGFFEDINTLTIFADYRVPQVLHYMGALHYSDELLRKLKQDTELENGDPYEVEIRGCTIWAAELITQRLKQQLKGDVNAVLVDFYLWELRRRHAEEMKSSPFHRVRSIYY